MTKDITVSVTDEVYRHARIHAAERGTSVSALVSDYLRGLPEGDAEFTRLEQQQWRVLGEIERFSAGDGFSRDEVHRRRVRASPS